MKRYTESKLWEERASAKRELDKEKFLKNIKEWAKGNREQEGRASDNKERNKEWKNKVIESEE